MMRRWAVVVAAMASAWTTAAAQETVVVRDVGPGLAGPMLQRALANPHTLIDSMKDTVDLGAGKVFPNTVIVLAKWVTISSIVHGDVIVVGGNVFVHPGAAITGRVIAIDGGAYQSSLDLVGGGSESMHDDAFAITRSGNTVYLDYTAADVPPRPSLISLPGAYGFAPVGYDRSNGLSLRAAADVHPWNALVVTPAVTYRSRIGAFDPTLTSVMNLDRRTSVSAFAGRTTLSNDEWAQSPLLNSLSALFTGSDSRNWYRSGKGELRLTRIYETRSGSVEPYIGARYEEASNVGPDATATQGAWSFVKRDSHAGMKRPNPFIPHDHDGSLIAGGKGAWTVQGIDAALRIDGEVGHHSYSDLIVVDPARLGAFPTIPPDGTFEQATVDGSIHFPTFGDQSVRFKLHAVATAGDAPRERWAYLGGSETLPTLDLLQLGGDELFYFDGRYDIPISRIHIPMGGSPIVSLHDALGSAGIGGLPPLTELIGIRLALGPVHLEWITDVKVRRGGFHFGLSLTP